MMLLVPSLKHATAWYMLKSGRIPFNIIVNFCSPSKFRACVVALFPQAPLYQLNLSLYSCSLIKYYVNQWNVNKSLTKLLSN